MVKHENESTHISMDNTRISEKTFSVPLGFGGYIITIVVGATVKYIGGANLLADTKRA